MKRKPGRPTTPSVIINKTHSDCTQFRLSTAVGLHGKSVSVEIDLESKKILIKTAEGGRLVNNKLGYFGFTSSESKIIPEKVHIPLTELKEGCWEGCWTGLKQ
ncbi:TPA: hypothetical protein ACF3IV_001843 [Enterobacter hormaechei]